MCRLDARKFPRENGVSKGETTVRLFTRLFNRIPRGLAMVTMGLVGIFGMRTPPDPEVITQTAPSPHAVRSGSDNFGWEGNFRPGEAAPPDEKKPRGLPHADRPGSVGVREAPRRNGECASLVKHSFITAVTLPLVSFDGRNWPKIAVLH